MKIKSHRMKNFSVQPFHKIFSHFSYWRTNIFTETTRANCKSWRSYLPKIFYTEIPDFQLNVLELNKKLTLHVLQHSYNAILYLNEIFHMLVLLKNKNRRVAIVPAPGGGCICVDGLITPGSGKKPCNTRRIKWIGFNLIKSGIIICSSSFN